MCTLLLLLCEDAIIFNETLPSKAIKNDVAQSNFSYSRQCRRRNTKHVVYILHRYVVSIYSQIVFYKS